MVREKILAPNGLNADTLSIKQISKNGLNGWWKLILGFLIGALFPSLIAWGSMSEKIESNKELIISKVSIETFKEYKEGNTKLLRTIIDALNRIDRKLDRGQTVTENQLEN